MSLWRMFVSIVRTRLVLVCLAYALRSVTAMAIAWPLAQRLAPANVMALPRMDRELFAPGARVLLGVLAEQSARLLPFWRWGWAVSFALLIVGSVGTAIFMTALAAPKDVSPRHVLRRAREPLPTVIATTAFAWAAAIAVVTMAKGFLPIVPALVYPLFGERGADVALATIALIVAFLMLVVFSIADLVRAASIVASSRLRTSFNLAVRVFRKRLPLCLLAPLGYFAACCGLTVSIEAVLPSTITASASTLALSALIHQTNVFLLCALHLSWWALALSLVRVSRKTKEWGPDNSSE